MSQLRGSNQRLVRRGQRVGLGLPPQRRPPPTGEVTSDQHATQQDTGDLPEHTHDLLTARDVAGVALYDVRRREHLDQVDAERVGRALTLAFGLFDGNAEDREGRVDPATLRRPPRFGRLAEPILIIARGLASRCDGLCGVGARAEERTAPAVIGFGHDDAAVRPDGRHRDLPVRNMTVWVEREHHLVDDASHDGERELGACLARPPVVDDEPACHALLAADAHGRHHRSENTVCIANVGAGDERATCQRVTNVVVYGCLSGRSDAGFLTVCVGAKTKKPTALQGRGLRCLRRSTPAPRRAGRAAAASAHAAIERATRRRFPRHWARNATRLVGGLCVDEVGRPSRK